MKKRLLFVLVTALFASQQAFAVPAYPHPVNYSLPDGSEIMIQLRGDEWINWAVTLDGYTMLFGHDGYLEYAVQDQFGDLRLSGIRARNEAERTIVEQNFLRSLPKNLRFSSSQVEVKLQLRGVQDDFIRKSSEEPQRAVTGVVRVPVILVAFHDKPFTIAANEIKMLLNQLNYTSNGLTGSVRDYYLANSNGAMDFQVDVFGPYTLPSNIVTYTDNYISGTSGSTCGGDPRNMARQAIDSAYANGCNFANYDPNNTGSVNTVHIIFAGYGTEAGAPRCASIWSHSWTISPARNYNGKSISRYSCSPELSGNSGSNLTNIGVIAHELGHSLLGLPDFYDADYATNGQAIDIGPWCLMASGSWNDNGRTPPFLSSYARVISGWVHEVILSDSANITLPNPATTNIVYRINTTTDNEYYHLENRQKTSWDAYVPNSGMLIIHVRRSSTDLPVWTSNCVNCVSTNRRYYIKQAGCATLNGCTSHTNDTWPQAGATEFTDNSTPNSLSWAGANTAKPITEITQNTGERTVSFKFMGGASNTYGIMLSQTDTHTFTAANYDYTAPTPLSVTITNTGNQPTGVLNITLSGPNLNDFTLSKTSVATIVAGDTDMFTVVPKTGLAVGTYTAMVTVSGNNGILERFNVSFTVNKANGAAVTTPVLASQTHYRITVNSVTTATNTDQTVQYAISTTHNADTSTLMWQNDTTFDNLAASTNYYVYGRSVENINYNDGTPSVSAVITTLATPTYGITLSQIETYTFTAATYGYSAQTPFSVTINNSGSEPTGMLNINLNGVNATNFELSKTSVTTIATGGMDMFTVVPQIDLAAGIYTATVVVAFEITGGHDTAMPKSFDVSFTVNKANGAAVTAPTLVSQTQNSVTVNAVTIPTNGQSVEYAIYTTNSAKSDLTWQAGTTFNDLLPSTTYYVYARSADHANYNAGVHSVSAPIVTLATPTHGIMLSQSGVYTFIPAPYGYDAQTPLLVTITNIGNQPTGELTIALDGGFDLSETSIITIAADSTDTFTVAPKTGLAVGHYESVVTVSGDYGISVSFNVSFTVRDVVAIFDFENDAMLKVYPNPVLNGKLVVEISDNIESETIQIYDFSGKFVLTRVVNRPKTEIDISHLPDGTYIVKIGHHSVKIIKR
ncbi:MAG: M6 family metalloprotease domain-containing protein [Bacteroidales bacterium]|nr:M6 family metalloprotease domain-containing protein [Bacteroidales bacterium]